MNSIITNPPSILTPTQQSNIATYGNPTGIKTYVALLTQTGTDAPVATVLENTLGGAVVWSYGGAGSYEGTLADAFPLGRTSVSYGYFDWNNLAASNGFRGTESTVGIITVDVSGGVEAAVPTNNILHEALGIPFIVRVYPA